jgi:hypothetical protein
LIFDLRLKDEAGAFCFKSKIKNQKFYDSRKLFPRTGDNLGESGNLSGGTGGRVAPQAGRARPG